jgi:hypothetical protein
MILLLVSLMGCQALNASTKTFPLEGSTARIGEPKPDNKLDTIIEVFTDRKACANDANASKDVEGCLPRIDRGSGEVQFSFQFLNRDLNPKRLPLTPDMLTVTHDNSVVGVGTDGQSKDGDIGLLRKGGARGSQLFVLLIDGSYSIGKTGGIKKVKEALLDPAVIDSFFPKQGGSTSGVMLLRWNTEVKTLDGGSPLSRAAIIQRRGEYKKIIEDNLEKNLRGYSHLYSSVDYTLTQVLTSPEIANWMELNQGASPTIVVLTDGYNNEVESDTCAANAPRLESLIEKVSATVTKLPKTHIYTVGLGKAAVPSFKLTGAEAVSAERLCGDWKDKVISGYLEEYYIDNPSLAFIARYGNGESFVKDSSKGLADVFLKASSQEYTWYTVRYRVPKGYLRRSFTSGIRLQKLGQGFTEVAFSPSPFLDAPSGTKDKGEEWTRPTSLRASLVPLLSVLGLLVSARFIAPAIHNLRRMMFRRAR